jgi:hypothetical protein
MIARAPIPIPMRQRLLRLLDQRPTIASRRISAPGNSVFSCQVVSVSRMPAVAPPQIQFSSGAARKTFSGPEKAATSWGLRRDAGKLSAM